VLTLPAGAWSKLAKPPNPAAEAGFIHRGRGAWAQIISEPIDVPLAVLRDVAVRNVKKADGQAEIAGEERRQVGGMEAVCLTINARVNGLPVTYHNLLYAGRGRAIQVLTWSYQATFERLKPELDALLNGFEVPAR
jgi:hypothetical protein